MKVIDWSTVLADWKTAEEKSWESLYFERGFDSWWEWRESYIEDLGLADRQWREEVIDNPHEVIPQFAIGGYRGWKKYRPAGKRVATYADVAIPVQPGELSFEGELRQDVRTNERVQELVGYLHDTTFLILQSPSLSVVLDGAHRCATIAVEAKDHIPYSNFRAFLRLATFSDEETNLLCKFAEDRKAIVKKKSD